MSRRLNEETDMERENTVIDLGSASVETRGPIGAGDDFVLRQNQPGLSDD